MIIYVSEFKTHVALSIFLLGRETSPRVRDFDLRIIDGHLRSSWANFDGVSRIAKIAFVKDVKNAL